MLPTFVLMTLFFCVIYTTIVTRQNISENVKRNNERTKQGYIGVSDDFKIINNNVYRYDTLIKGADAKTFETVSWNWQRDKNYYYYFGERIEYIDRNTFEDLDYHYGKDKSNVYYDENIIEGADAKTFIHIVGTQDGKDKNACYRRGEKVDCNVLLTEE